MSGNGEMSGMGEKTLSERLGLTPANEVMYDLDDEFASTVGSGKVGTDRLEADRRRTVEAVARYLYHRILDDEAAIEVWEDLLGNEDLRGTMDSEEEGNG